MGAWPHLFVWSERPGGGEREWHHAAERPREHKLDGPAPVKPLSACDATALDRLLDSERRRREDQKHPGHEASVETCFARLALVLPAHPPSRQPLQTHTDL